MDINPPRREKESREGTEFFLSRSLASIERESHSMSLRVRALFFLRLIIAAGRARVADDDGGCARVSLLGEKGGIGFTTRVVRGFSEFWDLNFPRFFVLVSIVRV